MLNYPLMIFTPDLGAPSETFIRRHVTELLPGKTAAITYRIWKQELRDWTTDGPVLELTTFDVEQVVRFLNQIQAQVLIGEYLDESFHLLSIARQLGIRFYPHAHGYDISEKLRDANWRSAYLRYNESDGIVTMSQLSRQKLIDIGITPQKIHVIPYGVNVPEQFRIRPARTMRCLAVGRMVPKKGPLHTLHAFDAALQKCPEMHLDFVGEGPLSSEAKSLAAELQLESRVTFHGWKPNRVVLEMMDSADIFLQHSITDQVTGDQEGLPVAILEAMAHGLPVISTNHAAIPEAVVHGTTGYLVDEGNTVEMSDWIVKLAHDPDARKLFGFSGWNRIKDQYSWEKERSQLLKLTNLQ